MCAPFKKKYKGTPKTVIQSSETKYLTRNGQNDIEKKGKVPLQQSIHLCFLSVKDFHIFFVIQKLIKLSAFIKHYKKILLFPPRF